MSFDSTAFLARLCEGGELFYHITKTKRLTEAQAVEVEKEELFLTGEQVPDLTF